MLAVITMLYIVKNSSFLQVLNTLCFCFVHVLYIVFGPMLFKYLKDVCFWTRIVVYVVCWRSGRLLTSKLERVAKVCGLVLLTSVSGVAVQVSSS